MNKLLVTLVTIAGFQFILFGSMWVASPYNIAASFGIYSFAEGLGLSSQIGDVVAYFTGIGLMKLFIFSNRFFLIIVFITLYGSLFMGGTIESRLFDTMKKHNICFFRKYTLSLSISNSPYCVYAFSS